MSIENKSPAEIQRYIYDQISGGTNPQTLREDLKQKGVPVEGYYFMSEADQKIEAAQPPSSSGGASAGQIIGIIVLIVVIILRIARCNNSM